MLTELQSISAVKAAAAYRRQAPGESAAAASPRGFGVIEDMVTLSPQALALLKNGAAGATEKTEPQTTEENVAKRSAPSDPFRAFRGADGEISLEAAMQLQMLPRHLRKAGELMREASSLRDEVNKMSEDPATDPEKLAERQAEYASAMGALWEELEKLGLAKKMGAADMSMDDLLNAGFNGLIALDEGETPTKLADDADKVARLAGATERRNPADASPAAWALDRGFE